MKKLLIILLSLTITSSALAQESIYLDKDKPAPFSGYLLPEERVKELRVNTIERDMYKSTNELKDQQIKLLKDDNSRLATTLQSTSSLSTWEKIGYFAAGVILTGLATKLAIEIYRQ